MALHRGIQSAVFYYISCAPCAEARYRKKRKKEAERGRAERDALHIEMPNAYRHPSPSSTNPHWQTEIEAGPSRVTRAKKKGNQTGESSRNGVKTSMTQMSNESNIASSADLSLDGGSRDGRNDSKLNFGRFQREEEELPGYASMDRLGSKTTLAGSTRSAGGITRPPSIRLRDGSHTVYRNPPVSDLHPAIATKIHSREEARWLMQPPPVATVMMGQETASHRSRSDSGGSSRLSTRSDIPLSRGVSQRILERKLRNGEAPPKPSMSRESSGPSSDDVAGQAHDRHNNTEETDFALDDSPSSRKARTRHSQPQIQVSEDSVESAATVIHTPNLEAERLRRQRYASRPQLSTIASDSLMPAEATEDEFYTPAETPREDSSLGGHSDASVPSRDRTARRSAAVMVKDDSLKVLQELAPHSAIFKTQVLSPKDLARTSKLPPQDASEDSTSAEMFDSWYTPNFQLDDWAYEHTKREVKHRWSMDI